MKFFKNKKGFTLVELVVVIAILGILAGIAIPRFMDATASARGAKIVADLRTIDSSIMMYQAKTASEPTQISDLTTAPNQFLASTPKPPTGTDTAIITTNAGGQVKITNAATDYTITNSRATLGTYTADSLMSLPTTTTTISIAAAAAAAN